MLLLEENRPLGVREVQRKMGFKSPSTAKYHLDRLVEFGLVTKNREGLYMLVQTSSKPPILIAYTTLFGMLIPRLIPYAMFFTVTTILYVILFLDAINIFAVFFGFLASALLWFEGFRFLKVLKRLKKLRK